MANYLAATLSQAKDAQKAYDSLVKGKFSKKQVTLLGPGKKSPSEVKVYDPNQAAKSQMKRMIVWLVPFGFFAGFTFNQITKLTILETVSPWVNGILGGLLGAGSGILGAVFIGGGSKLLYTNPADETFVKRVQAGKFVLVVMGTEVQLLQANRILRSQPYDLIQFYDGPAPGEF